MQEHRAEIADRVRQVFLVPPDFASVVGGLRQLCEELDPPKSALALTFLGNLRGIFQTLGLPFQLVFAQVHSLHSQRIDMAERIRSLKIGIEGDRESVARVQSETRRSEFFAGEGQALVQDEVLKRLLQLSEVPEFLNTARELTRQAVVLAWSAFEVLSRDLFVLLLNDHPTWVERLLAHPATRKRFTVEKLDWQTLIGYSFDLSSNVGTLLAERADLDDIHTIREAFGALFPDATSMNQHLSDERLWFLFQKRNLIVHRRGVVDQHYINKTGDTLAIGDQLTVSPGDIEEILAYVVATAEAMVRQVRHDG
jgi:hypothetical protein